MLGHDSEVLSRGNLDRLIFEVLTITKEIYF